ncbi:MAG: peptide ABC transporter substrate-binding protein, partial [Phycisphaeraceae bacterium]|nr:peptide ABC transporter substrate-binding protein [Phycisphaeraceae bacterium]
GYASPRYDELLATAAATLDPDARFRILEEAERILVEEDLPILPLCTYVTVYMYEPDRLRGLTRHPRLDQHPARWSVRR